MRELGSAWDVVDTQMLVSFLLHMNPLPAAKFGENMTKVIILFLKLFIPHSH